MSFISYSPNFEDVTLWRALGHLATGTYLDIGAQGPVDESPSRAFHERGWKGVHVAADIGPLTDLSRQRSGDIVIEAGIGARPPVPQGAGVAPAAPAITLDALLERIGTDTIHWMRVDLAHSRQNNPFEGWTRSDVLPWVIMVSAPHDGSPGLRSWDAPLLAKGYRHACSDAVNHYYVHSTHEPVRQRLVRACLAPSASPAVVGRLAHAERELLEMHIKLTHAEAQIAMADARAAKAELDAMAASAQAQQLAALQRHLHEVYASTSWQVTRPMRWLSRLRRSPRSAILEIGIAARTSGRRAARALVRRALQLVLTRPAVKRLALRVALRFPGFPGFLLRFKSRIKDILEPASAGQPQATPSPPPSNHTTVLGPRFRALILEEIQRLEHPSQQEHA